METAVVQAAWGPGPYAHSALRQRGRCSQAEKSLEVQDGSGLEGWGPQDSRAEGKRTWELAGECWGPWEAMLENLDSTLRVTRVQAR